MEYEIDKSYFFRGYLECTFDLHIIIIQIIFVISFSIIQRKIQNKLLKALGEKNGDHSGKKKMREYFFLYKSMLRI